MVKCPKCGNPLAHKVSHLDGKRWTSDHCWDCGYETTQMEEVTDLTETVTLDEIVDVHQALQEDLTIQEIVEGPK